MTTREEKKVEAAGAILPLKSPYIQPCDPPLLKIFPVSLKGENYEEWSSSMIKCLRAIGKLGFIEGRIEMTTTDAGLLRDWHKVNSVMMEWMVESIDPSLRPSIALFRTVKELWDYLEERFSLWSRPRKLHKVGLEYGGGTKSGSQKAITIRPCVQPKPEALNNKISAAERKLSTSALMEGIPSKWPRPVWRRPWKMYRAISGHLGCVRSIAFDPSNSWFCTGSADRTIKTWDLGTGSLKVSLTGHIGQIRGLAVSNKHPYMFSAGDDKVVKCWDLETNQVIRSYHGHLSGVYCLGLHPTIDVLLTGGRDSVCRVWDIRSKMQIHALSAHQDTVCSVFARPTDPQVVTGSHDSTINFWDLRKGDTITTLTHHKKSVRAMALHPKEHVFASASADNTKKFSLPKGEFLHNMLSQQRTIINSIAVNEDGVLATGGDNGSLWFWDWKSGHNFQQSETIVQPGSLESESAIYAMSYDVTGTRLVTCQADKTIQIWKPDEDATPQTHPLNFKPPKDMRRF